MEFIVITLGEHGADLYTQDELYSVPIVPPTIIVDPTGAGDAFRGGFLKGYLNGISLERCAQMGVLAATYCLENDGTQGHSCNLYSFITRFREHFDDVGELDQLL